MIKENVFYLYLIISIVWFCVGSLVVWRFALPELYKLLIKKQNITRHDILQQEQERREKRDKRKKA